MASFRERPEHELAALSDHALIEYLRAARAAGRGGAVRSALAILVFGYRDRVRWRVSRKVPTEHVDEVVADVLESALTALFAGESTGQFNAWLWTIIERRIADFFRARERRPATVPIDEEDGNDDDLPAHQYPAPDEHSVIIVREAVDGVLGQLRRDHREIAVRSAILREPATTIARDLAVSEANVHQIAKRFRDALRVELESER